MNERRRPSHDITPHEFFTGWLPAELARLGTGSAIPDMVVRFNVEGEGGGAWDLRVEVGRVGATVRDPALRPLVTLSLSLPDWRALMVGEQGPVSLTPPSASPTDLLFVDAGSQQLLSRVTGTFVFEVQGFNGRTWRLTATFGADRPSAPADATISTDAETYAAILARQISAPEAYFAGKITITGDAGRGMQVGLALLPKL
jgi:hypothetical protein